jgi:glutathione peroxidase-family protein
MQLRKHFINQVVINIEGCDKHEIEAFIKSFNLICLKTNFRKFLISKSFKIFLKFECLKKPTFLKILNKSPKLFIILASHMESFILGSEC